MKFNTIQSNDEQQNMINNGLADSELLRDRLKCFLGKSTSLFYSHIFDMSIQRLEEYKIFG